MLHNSKKFTGEYIDMFYILKLLIFSLCTIMIKNLPDLLNSLNQDHVW